jgi:hypothetical protein
MTKKELFLSTFDQVPWTVTDSMRYIDENRHGLRETYFHPNSLVGGLKNYFSIKYLGRYIYIKNRLAFNAAHSYITLLRRDEAARRFDSAI